MPDKYTGAPRGRLDSRDAKSIVSVMAVSLGAAAMTAMEHSVSGGMDWADSSSVLSMLVNILLCTVCARFGSGRQERFSVDLTDRYAVENAIYELQNRLERLDRGGADGRYYCNQRQRRGASPQRNEESPYSPQGNQGPGGWGK